MKSHTLLPLIVSSITAASALSAQTLIQFGGEAAKYTRINSATATSDDLAWQSQIGANEIIQWNGVNNSDQDTFGSFDSAGTFSEQTVADAATLSSSITPLVMSLVGIETTQSAGTPRVSASSTPNYIGVNDSSDSSALFNTDNNEVMTISFNQDVTLLQMIGLGMDFDAERWGVDVGNDDTYELQWNRSAGFTSGTGTVAAATFNVPGNNGRHVATFGSGIAVSAGTEISFTALQGNFNLHGLVVSTVPEPSSYALLAGSLGLALVMVRRR